MRLLVLGGTVFLGRAIVDEALEAGHEVTLFNRGRHSPDLYPQIEKTIPPGDSRGVAADHDDRSGLAPANVPAFTLGGHEGRQQTVGEISVGLFVGPGHGLPHG